MAYLKLKSVTCNETSGGNIELRVGSNILLGYTQIATADEELPKTVDFLEQGLFVPFSGSVAIDLYDDSLSIKSGNSVASSPAITEKIVALDNRTITYENSICLGVYIINYEVDTNLPDRVFSFIRNVTTLVAAIVVEIAAFLTDIIILITRPFTRLFGSRNDKTGRID